jgi:hypothetical protein
MERLARTGRPGNAEDGRKNLARRLSGWPMLCIIVGSSGAAAVALALTLYCWP